MSVCSGERARNLDDVLANTNCSELTSSRLAVIPHTRPHATGNSAQDGPRQGTRKGTAAIKGEETRKTRRLPRYGSSRHGGMARTIWWRNRMTELGPIMAGTAWAKTNGAN
jgi:hypothetical protein